MIIPSEIFFLILEKTDIQTIIRSQRLSKNLRPMIREREWVEPYLNIASMRGIPVSKFFEIIENYNFASVFFQNINITEEMMMGIKKRKRLYIMNSGLKDCDGLLQLRTESLILQCCHPLTQKNIGSLLTNTSRVFILFDSNYELDDLNIEHMQRLEYFCSDWNIFTRKFFQTLDRNKYKRVLFPLNRNDRDFISYYVDFIFKHDQCDRHNERDRHNKNYKYLNLSRCVIENEFVCHFHKLSRIVLDYVKVNESVYEYLYGIETVSIKKHDIRNQMVFFHLRKCKTLDIRGCHISPDASNGFEYLTVCVRLFFHAFMKTSHAVIRNIVEIINCVELCFGCDCDFDSKHQEKIVGLIFLGVVDRLKNLKRIKTNKTIMSYTKKIKNPDVVSSLFPEHYWTEQEPLNRYFDV